MKNILQENMRRIRTKNLSEGFMDIARLATYRDEFKTILTQNQSIDVINSTIESMIQDMGGPEEAAELMYGALESVDKIKSILKPLIGSSATLDVTMLNKIVDRLPFDEATKKQLNHNIMKLAQDLNVAMRGGGPDTSTGSKLT